MIKYGFYRENGRLKYRQLPQHILKNTKRKQNMKISDYCKLDTNTTCHCEDEVIQAVEYLEDEDE